MATGITTATSSDLEYMQRTVIAQARYTMEQRPCMTQLVEKFTLGQGEKQITVPKMGAFDDAADLTDGIDITTAQQLEDTYVNLTTAEIGLKCIVTDKLIRQMNEDVFRIVGKLLGESMARKVDKDGLAMLDGFGNEVGSTTTTFTKGHLTAAVAQLEAAPAPRPYSFVCHPYQSKIIMDQLAVTGTYPITAGMSADWVKNYWKGTYMMFGVDVYADGNLTIDASSDAKGGVFSKSALAYVVSKEPAVERERDASLRAWELVYVQDSDWVELDDAYGREMYFACATPTS
jgi:hypothetical protein